MIRLGVRVRRERAEFALAALLELIPNGCEESQAADGLTEYALYGEAESLPSAQQLAELLGDGLVEVTRSEVADDWSLRWREFHKPLVLGQRLSVRPPWEPAIGTEVEVVIDPGQAFGTGAHATTRLCLELLLDEPIAAVATPAGVAVTTAVSQAAGASQAVDVSQPALVDLGCGSGVLSITAAKLGWRGILALDNDVAAVTATAENAAVNGVGDAIAVAALDLRRDAVPAAPLTVANLLGPLLLDWAASIGSGCSPRPGRIIAGGLLGVEADTIAAAFAALGYSEQARTHRDEWAGLLLSRP